ncbi:hypothetical protein ScPMuIL_009679 [Solemya velum]
MSLPLLQSHWFFIDQPISQARLNHSGFFMDGSDGDGSGNGLGDSFLTSGSHFVVEGEVDDAVNSGENDDDPRDSEPLREQDRFLPIANVARIMKKSVPKNGKIAKDAKECVQECVSEFISFITSEASERCHQEKRKTINGEDILFAMSTLGFDAYVEPLKLYLQKYRESNKDKSAGSGDGTLEEFDESSYKESIAQAHLSNILTTTDGAGQSVIYATSYPNQLQSTLNFT